VTEIELDILDELYFVTSFAELTTNLKVEDKTLCQELGRLINRGYVKCFFPDPDSEVDYLAERFEDDCHKYFYLATKEGLLAHNSR
jgi:hypothetical protein